MKRDRVAEILSVIDRALGGPEEADEPRRHRYTIARRWWCETHDVIQSPLTDLERPRCPECGEWMERYDESADDPTRAPAPHWRPM